METRKVIVDYDALLSTLDDITKEDPERTYGHLDLLLENFQRNQTNILNGKCFLEIDDAFKKISRLGEQIEGNFKTIPVYGLPASYDQLLYYQVVGAMEQAKSIGIYDDIFMLVENK